MNHCSFLVILFFFLCHISPHHAISSNEAKAISVSIDEICENHKDPHFCKSFLKDREGSKVPFISQHTIMIALDKASNIKEKMEAIGRKTRDPRMMEMYVSCCEYYETGIQNLIESMKFLEMGDLVRMNTTSMIALENFEGCGSVIGPGFDGSVKKKHNELMSIEGIVYACNNLLFGKKPEKLEEESIPKTGSNN